MSEPGGDPSSGISSGDALILPEQHPACRRREARQGFRTERENLCFVTSDDVKGQAASGSIREGESAEASAGDPVAMVIADSVEAARNAAERIAVDYRILPAATEVAGRRRPTRPSSITTCRAISAVIGRSAMRRRPTPSSPRHITSPRSISSTTGWFPMQWKRGLPSRNKSLRPATTHSSPRPSFPTSPGC
jgi:hypothetical protein